ncbi:class F sortase [Pseudonocardia sp. GCM10023141]|uniref:class F sortase n=1 Tax=Pseudonocardia sp. GCM10023141 TaxID=3252653 RepID=UPI003613427B
MATAAAPAPTVPTAAAPIPPGTPGSAPPPARAIGAMPSAKPVGLTVAAIGVRTGALLPLGLDKAGALEVPPDATSAGWFTLGPAPGANGPAVIAAHVDYKGVAGVFSRLKDLTAGNEIRVARADGTVAVFTTYRVEHYPKSAFPTGQVYGNTTGPELRLITCGGSFDSSTGQYLDNVVAYARLTGSG